MTDRIVKLKDDMLSEMRYVSIEQAEIITESYKQTEGQSTIVRRAKALAAALYGMEIRVSEDELIVGNRTAGVRAGVVFPESGISWIDSELETMHSRPQDKFNVHDGDIEKFRKDILPYWQGRSLEDAIRGRIGGEVDEIAKVVKLNQKDHAQGHICPNTEKWLRIGPSGLKAEAQQRAAAATGDKKDFYNSLVIVLDGAVGFIKRYAGLCGQKGMKTSATICESIAQRPPETFHEAVQSLWFLYVILQMESNASSFSPGRADQYLYPFYQKDVQSGVLNDAYALEIIECLWLKFNQIVYLRNSHSARYFAGFPIGFNIAVGGRNADGSDASNALSYLFLKAQGEVGLPQPNLSARLHSGSPAEFVEACARVIGKGSGMPQIFNDEAVIPALEGQGISGEDAANYAIVGCVELTTHGNNLGWSDAAMFNLVKALELTLSGGKCLLTGDRIGPDFGSLTDYDTYEKLEDAFARNIAYFTEKMIACCEVIEQVHIETLPSPFLSCVIDDCMAKGLDVTAGGAHYNLSGIQAIQVANIADSLAALKKLVYDEKRIDRNALLDLLKNNYEGGEDIRQILLNKAPKYGNDIPWVDDIGNKWVDFFANGLKSYQNYRGGRYHTGLYTVSAHVPMGQNVGATPDGRKAEEPLADGGMSAVYGRDMNGPTALLKSVSRINSAYGSNGALLNMKFLPDLFKTDEGVRKFAALLHALVALKIIHAQFNVVRREDLIAARQNPEQYRGLTIRVAGYTAYFTELAGDLQEEIIARTSYGDL